MLRTFVWYTLTSFRNRLMHRARRLKQPRYLLSALVGVAYFGFFVFRRAGHVVRLDSGPVQFPVDGVVALLAAAAALLMLAAWGLPSSEAGLALNEAEVQFLFPAPLSRSQLVQFVILRAQLPLLVSTIVLKAFVMRQGNVIGLWAAMATLQVYFLLVKMARARLRVAGIGFLARAVAVTLVFGSLAWLVAAQYGPVFSALGHGGGETPPEQVFAAIAAPMRRAPLDVVFFVPALFARAAAARGAAGLVSAVPPLAILALIFGAIAVRLEVSYEDATIVRAQERSRKQSGAGASRAMRRVVTRRTPAPFRMAETGPPEVAIVWKNLIAASRTSLPILAIPAFVTLVLILVVGWQADLDAALLTGSGFLFAVAAFMVILGPMLLRNDLRLDFERLDVLRAYPISGPRMVTAQIAASALLIFAISACSFVLGCVLYFPAGGPNWPLLVTWGPLALVFALPLTAVQLLIHNGLIILLPGWAVMSREESRGIERTGRGLLLLISQLVLLAVGLLPASVLFAGGFWLSGLTLTTTAARAWVGAVPAFALLVWEIALALEFLGGQYERIDVSDDLRVTEA